MIMSTKEICKRGLSMTISLTLGNSRFPFPYSLAGHPHPLRHFLQGELPAFSEKRKILMNHPFLIVHIFHTSTLIVSRFLPGCNQPNATKPVRFGCENQTCPRMSLNSPGAWSVRLEPLSLLQRRLDFLPHLRLVGGHVVGAAVRP